MLHPSLVSHDLVDVGRGDGAHCGEGAWGFVERTVAGS